MTCSVRVHRPINNVSDIKWHVMADRVAKLRKDPRNQERPMKIVKKRKGKTECLHRLHGLHTTDAGERAHALRELNLRLLSAIALHKKIACILSKPRPRRVPGRHLTCDLYDHVMESRHYYKSERRYLNLENAFKLDLGLESKYRIMPLAGILNSSGKMETFISHAIDFHGILKRDREEGLKRDQMEDSRSEMK